MLKGEWYGRNEDIKVLAVVMKYDQIVHRFYNLTYLKEAQSFVLVF